MKVTIAEARKIQCPGKFKYCKADKCMGFIKAGAKVLNDSGGKFIKMVPAFACGHNHFQDQESFSNHEVDEMDPTED